MGFNLNFADPDRQPPRKRAKRSSRGIWLLPTLGLCLAACLMGDLLLSSGHYSSLLISDAGASIAAGQRAAQALISGR